MTIGQWTHEWAQTQKLFCFYKDEISSTNSYAKDFNHTSDALIVTDSQPQGRGRGTNTWSSPKQGTALLSSWVFLKEFTPQPILSPLIGLAVFKALESCFLIKDLSLKAPNDIYIKDKKLGGILVEIETQGVLNKIIIGIGLNILEKPKVAIGTSLKNHVKGEIKKNKFQELLSQLYINLNQALIDSQKPELSDKNQKEILKALNQNVVLKEKYKEVQKNGSLVLSKKTISWFEL